MGILFGFAPWIVYWVLVGNASFVVAALVAFAIAIAGLVAGYLTRTLRRGLEIGSGATFLVLTGVTLLTSQSFLQRWALPLSIAGILLVTLVAAQSGKSFVHEYAAANQPPVVVNSDVFGQVTSRLTWIWVGVFAGMTVSSSIPPIVAAKTSVLDTTTPADLHRLLGGPVLAIGTGRARNQSLLDLHDRRCRRHRPQDHVRRLPRGHHRRAVLPGPGTCQSRGRRGRGGRTPSKSAVWVRRWWATTPGTRGRPPTKCASRGAS